MQVWQPSIPDLLELREVYVKELERLFEIDPSDFSVVFQLAVEYARLGNHQRAKQLLSRVARSGYKEKELAVKYLEEWY